MKRNLLFAAMAVSILVSYSSDDVVDVNKSKGISFHASLDKALTRANVTNLQNLGEFNVTTVGNGAKYFTNLVVMFADNGASWTIASTCYWPTYEFALFAYSPQSLADAVSIDNTAEKITGFSPAQAVTDQKDLVISCNTGTKTTNENTGVAINFKHVLSQIEVKAKCSNDKVRIEALGIKLINAAAKTDFTFPEEYTGSGYVLSQDKWSDWQDKDDHGRAYVIKGQAPVTLTADVQSIMFSDDNFMLIPQQLTKWDGTTATIGAYLSVLCRISTLDGGSETLLYSQPTSDNRDGKYASSAVGIDTNWEPGRKYTYTLNFRDNDGGGGKIDPSPTDPTEPDNPNVDPTPIPDGNGGDPILGDPIKFTVTADSWIDQPVDISM